MEAINLSALSIKPYGNLPYRLHAGSKLTRYSNRLQKKVAAIGNFRNRLSRLGDAL
jgi:hypothetical protein